MNLGPRLYVRVLFEPRDLWIGLYRGKTYWEMGNRMVDLYICILPMIPILVNVTLKKWAPEGSHVS